MSALGAYLTPFTFNPAEKRGPDGKWIKFLGDKIRDIPEALSTEHGIAPLGGHELDKLRPKFGFRERRGRGPADLKLAINTYTGSGYEDVNFALRSGHEPTGYPGDMSRILHDAMQPAHRDLVLSRWATPHAFGPRVNSWSDLKSMEGALIRDPAFSSTSADPNIAPPSHVRSGGNPGELVKLRIRAPKGTRALSMEADSKIPGEREVLLDRGTSFYVDRVYRDPNSQHVIVELSVTGQR